MIYFNKGGWQIIRAFSDTEYLTVGSGFMHKCSFRRIISIALVLAIILCCLPLGMVASATGETLRVGVCSVFGISKVNNRYEGFAYEYLNAMQAYTGYKYTFIEAKPDELMKMLADGVIDVIPCVTEAEYEYWADKYFDIEARSAEGDAVPQLCNISLMKKYTAIYVRDSGYDTMGFMDKESLNKATIGYLSECEDMYFLDGRFIRGEIDMANFVAYDTVAQMKSDFDSGKVDAVVKSCFHPWENEKIVYQYSTSDCYMLVSGEDPEIVSKFDVAVNSTYMADASFGNDLYNKYIEKYGAAVFAFSNAEKAYIENHPTITVAYNDGSSILENFDSNSGHIVGYTDTVLRYIEDVTGFTIEVKRCASLEECISMLADGKADAICGGANEYSVAEYGNYIVSFPYAKIPIVTIGRENTVLQGNMKIAIPYYSDIINDYAANTYTNATLLPYDSLTECVEAICDGTVDIACANLYEAAYVVSAEHKDLSIIDTSTTNHLECFVYNSDNLELRDIFGKCISSLGGKDSVVAYSDTVAVVSDMPAMGMVSESIVYLLAALLALLVIGLGLLTIITLKKRRHNETTDPLTGGRNRQKYIEDTQKLFKKSPTDRWAIALFDINKFKYVNDQLGYEEGDRMLERLYKTIADEMESDEVFARVSDDNFACTMHAAQDAEIMTRLNNIFADFERRNNMFVKYSVIFSAGVCRLCECKDGNNNVDVNAALDRCTIAKKTLKGMHYTSIAFYDGKIRDKALREKDYENIMPTALEQREFECYLQPKYGLRSRCIEGAEALIRWNSKEFGFVFPNDFIPISEKNGFVVELDFFILEEVCKAIRRWLDDGKTPIVISVNQSRLHLNYDDYIWRLREIVDKYDIPYKYIELELTESVFMENADKLLTIVRKLHDIGFKLSIDDFGSGYSSLNMLKDIPVDVVKIDREFFNGTVNSERGRAVISTVVDLAKNLDMQVISEGVETIEQVEFLTEINCAMVQGYYFAKPMTMSDFEALWQKELDEKAAKLADSE